MRVNLPEYQADSLRASKSVQGISLVLHCYGYIQLLILNVYQSKCLQGKTFSTTKKIFLKCAQAYVGGLYRDQGLDVIRKWIISLVRPHVEAAYQNLRDDYTPVAIAIMPGVPMASYPSPPPSSASSDGAGPASPSRHARDSGEFHRSPSPRVNVPQQGSGRAAGGADNHPENIHQSRSNNQRRRSGQGNGRSGDSGEKRTCFTEALSKDK